jgi:CTP:molybdopterin cytidylyltransferase MocA
MTMAAIILAAGASRRLGQPKQLVRIAGETLLARTIRIACESALDPILVVLGAHHEHIAVNVDLSVAHPVVNPNWEQGIATSIQTGVHALLQFHPRATAAMLLVCDQPRLVVEHLRTLVAAYEQSGESSIVASEYAGIAGIPTIFPASQFASLQSLQGDTGARYLLRDPHCAMITKEFDGGEIDIDLPSDLPKK